MERCDVQSGSLLMQCECSGFNESGSMRCSCAHVSLSVSEALLLLCCSKRGTVIAVRMRSSPCMIADTLWCVCAGTKEVHSRCDVSMHT